MPELFGQIRFASMTGRTPWSGITATGNAVVANAADPLDTLATLERLSQATRHAGFFSYDLGRCFEDLPTTNPDKPQLPLFAFVPVDESPAALSGAAHADGEQSRVIMSTFTRPAYEAAVQRCLDYIAAGDVFQINLSQRLAVRTDHTPLELFVELQDHFPAEYTALLDFGHFAIVSNSPELFLKVERLPDGRRRIINRPIKGTRPNAPGMADELLHSEKDQAELAMIVDLQRNDLGRICEIGSIKVNEPRTIETHPTVLHGVATVEGILRENVSLTDILRATFPCGSITGCPKIRAMQIIDELEPVRRGAYCGAIGWIGGGEMELSVAIRTMTLHDGVAYVPVGGGIVADSTPAAEYEETLVKARAMLAALGVR
ncbi:MAG: chorismate-binding protein [Tepidisphaeraceae bacterium]